MAGAQYSRPALVRGTTHPECGRSPDCASQGPRPRAALGSFREETASEDQAHHPRSSVARRTRLVALAAGLAAVGALATPTAHAGESAAFSSAELTSAAEAVLDTDVAGTAWYVDKAANKVVVTADSTVSKAEIAKIRKAAGGEAGALEINRTEGTFSPLLSGGDAIYSSSSRCSSASTCAAAARTTR